MKCNQQALFRYTWAGQDEKFCCLEHAQQLQNVARSISYYVQLIPLSGDEQMKAKCTQEVRDSETAVVVLPVVSKEEKMKAFIRDLFQEYFPDCGDIDGATLQDLAEKHEILVPELRHEPCGEFCNCAQSCSDEEFQEGVRCYHVANWVYPQQGD